jgi:N-acetylneuraminate lyase
MPIRLISAPHTPFAADGSLNVAAVARQAQHLRETGVVGAFIGGSTGEYASLTVRERIDLAEAWAEQGPQHGIEVIVHVGHNCQQDAVALARHAGSLGATAVAALAPSYFKPGSPADLVEFFRPVAAACDLPFYFYDIPGMTGVNLPTVEFLRLAAERIPTLKGIKFTNPDLAQFQECFQFENGRYDILFGTDEILLAGYVLGARGAVGSTYNFAAPLYHQVIDACDRGDLPKARRLQADSVRLVRMLQKFGYMASAKTLMSFLGVECGTVRPPLRPLSDEQRRELRGTLAKSGLYDQLRD